MSLIVGATAFKVYQNVTVENSSSPGYNDFNLFTTDDGTQIKIAEAFFQGKTFEYSYSSEGIKTVTLVGTKSFSGTTYTDQKSVTFDVGFVPSDSIYSLTAGISYDLYPAYYAKRGISFEIYRQNSSNAGTTPVVYTWDFYKGITYFSTSTNPQKVLYNTLGIKHIGLTATNRFGSVFSSLSVSIIDTPVVGITSTFGFGEIEAGRAFVLSPKVISYNGHNNNDIFYRWLISGTTYTQNNPNITTGNTGILGITLFYASKIIPGLSGSTYQSYNVVSTYTPAVYYVSDSIGNDAWSGITSGISGTQGPVKTLKRASKLAVGYSGEGDVEVQIAAGTYRFLEQSLYLTGADSGLSRTIVYKPFNNGRVIISGGYTVSPSLFTVVTAGNTAIYNRLKVSARGNVYEADISGTAIPMGTTFPVFWTGRNVDQDLPDYPELYFDGNRMTLARWPNKINSSSQAECPLDYAISAQIAFNVERGSFQNNGTTAAIFGYTSAYDSVISSWKVTGPSQYDGIWMHGFWRFDWRDEIMKVRSIDKVNRRITLESTQCGYGVGRRTTCVALPGEPTDETANPSPRRWYAFNLLEELDSAGEYYIDRANKKLYLWPPTGITSTSSIVLSSTTMSGRNSWVPGTPEIWTEQHPVGWKTPLNTIKANASLFKFYELKNVRFENLEFLESAGSGIELTYCENVTLKGCTVDSPRKHGIVVYGGKNNIIDGCNVRYCGLNGVILTGGDRQKLIPANNTLTNSRIIGAGQNNVSFGRLVILSGVGNKITKNVIANSGGIGMAYYGNDHVIEYNNFSNLVSAMDDCGGLYTNYNVSDTGTLIRYNFFNNVQSQLPGGYVTSCSTLKTHGTHAIYYDHLCWGEHTVQYNVFNNCGDLTAYPKADTITLNVNDAPLRNNIFVDCPVPGVQWAYNWVIDNKGGPPDKILFNSNNFPWNEGGNPIDLKTYLFNPYTFYASGYGSAYVGLTGVSNQVNIISDEWRAHYPNFARPQGEANAENFLTTNVYMLPGNPPLTGYSVQINSIRQIDLQISDNVIINATGSPFLSINGYNNTFQESGTVGTGKFTVGQNYTGGTALYSLFEDKDALNFKLTTAGLAQIKGTIPGFEDIPFEEIPVL